MKNFTFLIAIFLPFLAMAQPPANAGVSFNGIDEFILIPDSDNINTTPVDNRTIETYFKVNDATARQVIYKEGAEVNTIKFYVENGFLHVGSYKNDGGPGDSIWFRTPVSDDTWYHVALVLENASTLSFYLNGVLQDSNPNYFQLPVHPGNFELARTQGPARYPNCATWTPSGSVEVCLDDVSSVSNTVYFFGGRIYAFRIWDVVRTAQEIDDNKEILITDTSTAPGDDLIAFLDGSSMSYVDDNGDFDTENVQGNVLGVEDQEASKLNYLVKDGVIMVQTELGSAPETIALFNLTGKKVIEANSQSSLSIAQFADGIYILQIVNQGNVLNRKIVIQNK